MPGFRGWCCPVGLDELSAQPSQSNSFSRNNSATNSSCSGIQRRFAYSSSLLAATMGTILVPSYFSCRLYGTIWNHGRGSPVVYPSSRWATGPPCDKMAIQGLPLHDPKDRPEKSSAPACTWVKEVSGWWWTLFWLWILHQTGQQGITNSLPVLLWASPLVSSANETENFAVTFSHSRPARSAQSLCVPACTCKEIGRHACQSWHRPWVPGLLAVGQELQHSQNLPKPTLPLRLLWKATGARATQLLAATRTRLRAQQVRSDEQTTSPTGAKMQQVTEGSHLRGPAEALREKRKKQFQAASASSKKQTWLWTGWFWKSAKHTLEWKYQERLCDNRQVLFEGDLFSFALHLQYNGVPDAII